MFTLTVTDGTHRPLQVYYVVERATLGRDPACDVVLTDRRVSLRHVEVVDTGVAVVLASSSPGLTVGGRARTGRVSVEPAGARLALFDYALLLSPRHLPDELAFPGAEPDAGGVGVVERLLTLTRAGDPTAAWSLYREARRRGEPTLATWSVPLATPSRLAWQSLVLSLGGVGSGAPLDALVQHAGRWLEGWADALREAPSAWWGNVVHGVDDARWPLVRALSLGADGLSASAVAALCERSAVGCLSRLSLAGAAAAPEVLRRLAGASGLRSLRHLDLSGCRVSAATLEAFCAGDVMGGLETLCCSGCGVDDEGATALARSPAIRGLRSLDLSHNAIGAAGGRSLARSPHVVGLETLDLRGNALGTDVRGLLRTTSRLRPGALRY